jgi:hypothetical protein
MPFSGLSTFDQFTATGGSLIAEDISETIKLLSIRETPLLSWLGDADTMATNVAHEFIEEELRPNYLTNSTAIASDTAATGIRLLANGDLLTVGTIIENETQAEVMQVTSVVGPFSVLVSRNFGSGGIGSLAAGGRLFVREPLALEGQDATGDVTRPRRRRVTYVKMFQLPITISDTQLSVRGAGGGGDEWERQKSRRFAEVLRDLEKSVIRGVASGNSIGSESVYRSFNGLRASIGSINSLLGVGSLQTNPHLYIGNAWNTAYDNGLRDTDTIALVCGRDAFAAISNLNDTKVQDSNDREVFKRKIRTYTGPFGSAEVILSPWMPALSILGVARERVKVVPLDGRAFQYTDLAKTGSARKGMVEGEYTLECHHPQTLFQIRGA